MDKKLIASKEDDEREVWYISRTYDIPIQVVRDTILEVGQGKQARSREDVYAALRAKNYDLPEKDGYKGDERLPDFDGEIDEGTPV